MQKYYNVQGSQVKVPPIEVNVDTVYVRTNVTKLETEDFNGWSYDEVQYSHREYLELLVNQSDINDLKLQMARSSTDMFQTMTILLGGEI